MKLSRRTVLKGMLSGAVVTVGVPFLDVFLDDSGTALANGTAFPSRFGLFYWGNGVHPERWVPSGEGPDWELTEQLEPLADVKDDISIVTGTEVKTPNTVPHNAGLAGILTGAPLIVEGEHQTFAGPSVDQVIARAIGDATRFRSLEYGAEAAGGYSYNGPDNRNPAETDPYALFERIFGAGFREPGETTEVDPTIGLRRSVLDAVLEDTDRLRNKVGAADRIRLEQHLDGIRELELRLARLEEDPPELEACIRPEEPLHDYPDLDGRPQIRAKNRALCDIVAMALACDQTRVFSNFMTGPVNNLLFQGASAGHHQLTHDEPGDQPEVNAIVKQIMGEFAYMVESLSAIREGDGRLLDSCIVLGTTDVSRGRTHTLDEFPILLAGTGGGALQRGIHYRSKSSENASRVILTLIRALGVNQAEFGLQEGRVSDGIGGLEA